MSNRLNLHDRTIFTYVFPTSDTAKIHMLSAFWLKFNPLCEHQSLETLEGVTKLPQSAVILFIVTSLADLDVLVGLKLLLHRARIPTNRYQYRPHPIEIADLSTDLSRRSRIRIEISERRENRRYYLRPYHQK
jgi:hypothetical protein